MKSLRTLLCVSLVWCVANCAKSDSYPETTTPEVATTAPATTASSVTPTPVPSASPTPVPSVVPATVPTKTAAPLRTQSLTFVPSELVPGNVAGVVKHCLNCNRRASTYEYCHFDSSALHAAVGKGRLSVEITVKVSMAPLKTEMYKPDDPNAPQPEGGFVKNAFTCLVLEVEPVK